MQPSHRRRRYWKRISCPVKKLDARGLEGCSVACGLIDVTGEQAYRRGEPKERLLEGNDGERMKNCGINLETLLEILGYFFCTGIEYLLFLFCFSCKQYYLFI